VPPDIVRGKWKETMTSRGPKVKHYGESISTGRNKKPTTSGEGSSKPLHEGHGLAQDHPHLDFDMPTDDHVRASYGRVRSLRSLNNTSTQHFIQDPQ